MCGGGDVTGLDMKLLLSTLSVFRVCYLEWLDEADLVYKLDCTETQEWNIHIKRDEK